MPQVDLEAQLAAKIQELREHEELTYRQLADRLKAEGCNVNPGTIQKTEKAGRRVPVDELVGYARAFDMSLNDLLGIPDDDQGERAWPTYLALERLGHVLRVARDEYRDALREVTEIAQENPELVSAISRRLDKNLATFTDKAKRQAEQDGFDVSTPEKLDAYIHDWGFHDVPVIVAARDVLKGVDHGEGE
ncbi:helix-turn-helix transcriptional regulator [Brevibacterium salitolerans]|uniref:HTH cro/C1-type domain-containing protein n=1 Tax=Brevibacterium salitolerans TaxID=1403566 RepID=A0ABP5I2S4_9MICO